MILYSCRETADIKMITQEQFNLEDIRLACFLD